MTERASGKRRFFDDDPRHLDRFGSLLILSGLAAAVNMLVDLEDPTSSWTNEVGWLFVSIVTGATLILAASASGVSRRWRRVIGVIVSISVGLALIIAIGSAIGGDAEVVTGRPNFAWVLIAAAAPLFVLRRIFRHDRVTGETIAGAVAVFLLIALAFSYLFGLIDQWSSTPFFGADEPTTSFMYFSLVTITTLGYGDLSPATEVARLFATTQAVIGQIFLVVVVARLVSLFGTDTSPQLAQRRSGDSDDAP